MIRRIADIVRLCLRHWLLAALLTSAAMLAIAYGFQYLGGLNPCQMCLWQRYVYFWAMGVSAAGLIVQRTPLGHRLDRVFAAALLVIFLIGVRIAGWHAAIEWKWLPELPTCGGVAGKVTAADLQALLNGPAKPLPSCSEAQWRWLGLSMAGWNVLISFKLAAFSALAALDWKPRRG